MRRPTTPTRNPAPGRACAQQGMTLVELMVALVLGLLIVLAAASSLLVARLGFGAVDAASQLRDNSRFLQNLVQQLGSQAGYQDPEYASDTDLRPNAVFDAGKVFRPVVFGLNNSSGIEADAWDNPGVAHRSANAISAGSDVLVLRYSASAKPGGIGADDTMVDCLGASGGDGASGAYAMLVSVLHVAPDRTGEPALKCTRFKGNGTPETQPLISGVENFQVLYGVNGIDPDNRTVPITPSTTGGNIPTRYLRANEITVSGDKNATDANWAQVRSLRIGVVLRGPPGSAIDRSRQTLYPLGITSDSATAAGNAFSNTDDKDPGTRFTPPDDGRLRQVLTFTVRIRNFQGVY